MVYFWCHSLHSLCFTRFFGIKYKHVYNFCCCEHHYVLSILGDVNNLFSFLFSFSVHLVLCALSSLIRCYALKIHILYFMSDIVDNVCAFSINYNLCSTLSLALALSCPFCVYKWIELFTLVDTTLWWFVHQFPCTLWLLCTCTSTCVSVIQPQWGKTTFHLTPFIAE